MGHVTLCKHATVKVKSSVFSGIITTAIIDRLEFGLILAAGQLDSETDNTFSVFPVATHAKKRWDSKGLPILKMIITAFPQLTLVQLSHFQQEDETLSSLLKLVCSNSSTSNQSNTVTKMG